MEQWAIITLNQIFILLHLVSLLTVFVYSVNGITQFDILCYIYLIKQPQQSSNILLSAHHLIFQ